MTRVTFLGHELSGEGVKPSKEKVDALAKAPAPKNLSELKSFLGMINYYRKFIKNMAHTLHPLYDLDRKDVKFRWSQECEEAFEKAKLAIINSPLIVTFDLTKKTILTTDASQYGIGAVLSQEDKGIEKVVQFYSRTLTVAERKLPQIQREALAIVDSIKHFHKYLFGHKFMLITDHEPLKAIFGTNKSLPQYTINRLQHYAIFLQSYDYEIRCKKGLQIGHADCFSRLPIESNEIEIIENEICSLSPNCSLINANEIAKETEKDLILKEVKNLINNGFPVRVKEELMPYRNRSAELEIVNDCIFWNSRLIVPSELRNKVLSMLHEQHVGITRMKLLCRKEFWWPNLTSDIESMVANCGICQRFDTKPNPNCELSS